MRSCLFVLKFIFHLLQIIAGPSAGAFEYVYGAAEAGGAQRRQR